MKLRLLALAALVFIAANLGRADNYSSRETFTRTGEFNPSGEVTLENINGDVDIHTWDKNEILIEGEKSAASDEELKLIDLSIDLTSARAVIKVRLPKRPGSFFFGNNIRGAVRFKLTLPASAVLAKIASVNGAVTLSGVNGSVHGETVNGSIHATGLGGDVSLETVNGSIKAKITNGRPQQKLRFETVNGQITVTLPRDAGFQLHSSVVNGSIDCDFPLESGKSKHGRTLSGKIGDGRASLDAQTVNGSIHLEQQS